MVGHRVSTYGGEQENRQQGREYGMEGGEGAAVLMGWSGMASQRRCTLVSS